MAVTDNLPREEDLAAYGAEEAPPRAMTPWRRFSHSPLAMLGLGICAFLVLLAIVGPWLAPYSPYTQYANGLTLQGAPLPPDRIFPLGTDPNGRDVLSRLLYGTRVSLGIAIFSNVISILIAALLGSLAGYFGGVVDTLVMRLTDVLQSVPVLLLAGFAATVFRPSITIIVLIIAFVAWYYPARVIRGEVLSLRHRDFVQAARAIGASHTRILFRHVIPQVFGLVAVYATLNFSYTILFTSTLSFIGIGVQPPTPDWGNMIAQGAEYLTAAPWLMIFPGIALGLAVLGFNLLGDGLRDAYDPRSRL
jgi:peptide/nickel transport system permease protein